MRKHPCPVIVEDNATCPVDCAPSEPQVVKSYSRESRLKTSLHNGYTVQASMQVVLAACSDLVSPAAAGSSLPDDVRDVKDVRELSEKL